MEEVTLIEQGVCSPVQQSSVNSQDAAKETLLALVSLLPYLDFLIDVAALHAVERRCKNACKFWQLQMLL